MEPTETISNYGLYDLDILSSINILTNRVELLAYILTFIVVLQLFSLLKRSKK